MLSDEVDHINIDSDQDWETSFIPWLEDQENSKVGAEDGVFVATVDSSIRFIQPQNEDFLQNCVEHHLSTVSTQRLKRFTSKGLFHLGVHSAQQKNFNKFKEEAHLIHSYKDDTCCSRILSHENDLKKLFRHIHSDVILEYAKEVANSGKPCAGTSIVLLEEAALKMKQDHLKYSQNINQFTWEKTKKAPPKECHHVECTEITDSDESDFLEEEKHVSNHEEKRVTKNQRSLEEDDETGHDILYGHGVESCNKDIKVTANLNLSKIFNILWLLPNYYPGFHSSYLYFGTRHSMFPVHVEDGLCWGLNFHFMGHPKIWVIIPPWATDLLDFHLQKGGLYLRHSSCRNLLGHKSYFPTVCWLEERGIPFKVVVQRPGDLVVLYPNAPHFGFNLGHNIAQAVNIATTSWIPTGINAKKCTCLYVSVFHCFMTDY